MRNLEILTAYFIQFLKSRMEYKGDFFASIFANILVAASGLLFVLFLIDGSVVTEIKGWSRAEVLFIYGYSMIPMSLFNIVAPNLYRFGDKYIIEGQFDRVLLRPLNSLQQVLCESFNLESIGSFFVGLIVLFYSASSLGIALSIFDYLWLLGSSVSGAVLLVGVFVILSSLSFHFEDRLGVSAPVFNLISFSRYPLPIFNNLVQWVLRWVVPFAFVSFYPATHFLTREGFAFYCYFSPIMAGIVLALAAFSWQFGVSRYCSTGN